MDHKTVEDYILSMPNSQLDYPFGEGVAVYKAFIPSRSNKPGATHTEGVQGDAEQHKKSQDGSGAINASGVPDQSLATQVSREQGDAEPSNGSGAINASGVHGAEEHRSESYTSYVERDAESATQQSAANSEQEASSAGLQATEVDGSWKMFALIAEGKDPVRLSLKCDPLLAETLRQKFETVLEGYHLNKKHWNTILLTGQLPWEEIQGLIRHSYDLVTKAGDDTPIID